MYPSGVGADLGPTPTTLGVKPAAGDDPAGLQTGTDQGRTYWRTNQTAGTDYLEFDVDRDYVDEIGSDDVLATVTYLDQGTGTLELQYDAASNPQQDATDLQLTGTGTWKTGVFELTGIGFTNRLGDADLRPRSSSAPTRSRAASVHGPATTRRIWSPACRTAARTGRPTAPRRLRAPTSSI
jgi:hypothetical protein